MSRTMKKIPTCMALALLFFFTCEDYQDESYIISVLDEVACTLLEADTLNISIDTYEVSDTTLVTTSDTIAILDTLDTLTIFTVRSDSSWTINLIADTSYRVFEKNGSTSNVVFFIDKYLNTELALRLTASNGTILQPVDIFISLETIAKCPLVRMRNVYALDAGKYLVRFICDNTIITEFNAVVLNEG